MTSSLRHSAATLIFISLFGLLFYQDILFYPNTYVFRDMINLYLPFERAIKLLSEKDIFPMWNPYQVLGKPMVGEPLSGLLYPFNWLLWLLPQPFSYNFSLFFHHLIAFFGLYLFLRLRDCLFIPAIIGGLLYSFGGFLISMDNVLNTLQATVWAPWAVMFFQRWLLNKSYKNLIFTSLAIFLVFVGGQPEIFIMTNIVLLSIGIESLLKKECEAKQLFFVLVLINFVGLALSAYMLFPFIEFILNSSRSSGISTAQVLRYSFNPENLLGFFIKENIFDINGLFNGDILPAYKETPWAISRYLGPSLLLSFFCITKYSPRTVSISIFLLIFALLLSFGEYIPGYASILDKLPFLRIVRYPEKFLLIPHAVLCLGVAFGVQQVIQRYKTPIWLSIVLLVFISADIFVANWRQLPVVPWDRLIYPTELLSRIDNASYRIYSNEYHDEKLNSFEDIYQTKKNLLDQNTASLFGVSNLNVPMSVNLKEHEKLNELILSSTKEEVSIIFQSLNVGYVTSQKMLVGYPNMEIVPLADVTGVYLHKINNPAPRVFVPQNIYFVDPQAALQNIKKVDVRQISNVSILSDTLQGYRDIEGQAGIKYSSANKVEIDANMQQEGVVVLNDSYYPGWKVLVDGKKDEILRVNGLVRGVMVPPGQHKVIFIYSPNSFWLGIFVSLLTILLIFLYGRLRS